MQQSAENTDSLGAYEAHTSIDERPARTLLCIDCFFLLDCSLCCSNHVEVRFAGSGFFVLLCWSSPFGTGSNGQQVRMIFVISNVPEIPLWYQTFQHMVSKCPHSCYIFYWIIYSSMFSSQIYCFILCFYSVFNYIVFSQWLKFVIDSPVQINYLTDVKLHV